MSDQELKNLWENSIIRDEIIFEEDKLIYSIKRKTERLNRNIKRRNLREYIASFFAAAVFVVSLFLFQSFQIKAGATIIIISLIFIVYKLRAAEKNKMDSNPAYETKNYLMQVREKLDGEIYLLSSIIKWYLSPLFVGAVVFFLGFPVPLLYKIIYPIAALILFAVIYLMNKRAVRNHLIPLRNKVSEQLSLLI